MSEAEKFLNKHKDGYNSFKIQEMICLPKIKIQALMSEFSDEQFESRVNATISKRSELLKFLVWFDDENDFKHCLNINEGIVDKYLKQ
jgi:hypothetical protein